MVWFLVNDNLTFHSKVTAAGNTAMGVWVRCGAWSTANLSDGFIPSRVAESIGRPSTLQKLVNCGLFESVTDGYLFHDWGVIQTPKCEVEAKRKRDRERKAEQRRHENVREDVARDLAPARGSGRPRPHPTPPIKVGGLVTKPTTRSPTGAAPPAAAAPRPDDFYDSLERDNCPLCDEDGYRGNIVCDHIDRTETARNGMAAVRAALTKKPQPL